MHSALLLGGPFFFAIQIALCVHVYKTGRPYWWIWLLMMGSFLGCLIYFLIEVLPELRRSSRGMVKPSWFVPKSVMIRRARERLEETDTIAVRLELAELLFDAGEIAEAADTAAPAVSGVFKDDPQVI